MWAQKSARLPGWRRSQPVLYVTERCVFRLADAGGLELIEIAPGIDLERDILAQMDFTPAIGPDLKLMEASLFAEATMNLRERMLTLPLAERIEYDPRGNMLFINFEGLTVECAQDVEEIETEVSRCVEPLGRRVNVVVNAPACSAPCTAPAAPASLCISITCGTMPQMFFWPDADQASASSPIVDDGVIG